jgi:hypothetical protein
LTISPPRPSSSSSSDSSRRAAGPSKVGEVERYEDIFRLCYVRGPEGIIIELAERIG